MRDSFSIKIGPEVKNRGSNTPVFGKMREIRCFLRFCSLFLAEKVFSVRFLAEKCKNERVGERGERLL